MGSADVQSPQKGGFYQAFKESFFFSSAAIPVESDSRTAEEVTAVTSTINLSSSLHGPVADEPTHKSKPKNKHGKKKEIVSSSSAVPRLEVCIGKKCKAKGSEDLLAEFQKTTNGRVEIAYTKCMKECKQGMNVRLTKDGSNFEWHHEVSGEDVEPILCKHFDW